MTYIPKPRVRHPSLEKNTIGLTVRDYEGVLSTLCAGCGHDSITAAIVHAAYELAIPPHLFAKTSGIGCSSKTPAYFIAAAHGFNSVHGRMPSVTTGAYLAHKDLHYLGVSGDGDTASIGLGQFLHAIRRNLNMLYIVENNGVYGLTKGQFSATADPGSKSKKGDANPYMGMDTVALALELGASFVARSFSGDKAQLVPLIMAGLQHKGFALIDVVSPCVTFNNHEGSTRSYQYMREHEEVMAEIGYVPQREEIQVQYAAGETISVALHDGGAVQLHKLQDNYKPTDLEEAKRLVSEKKKKGVIVTGLLYINPDSNELHDTLNTVDTPLRELAYDDLCPKAAGLAQIMASLR